MWLTFTITLLFLLISYIPIRLTAVYIQHPHPDAILMLGGGIDRELYTAEFARTHSDLDIWVSTGMPLQQSRSIFQAAQIRSDRLHLDRRAIDTVTNFTSLVKDFKLQGIRHLFLITSDFHMSRAQAIAFLVLGSQGIAYTPVAVPSSRSGESGLKVVRDVGRSLLWLTTGCTAASLHPQRRREYLQAWRSWAQ
ncbi:MAG: YdcF family protein [Cyanothece sp. SIO2G6]|nr:YdcF family protein [Cyanothece sp. SIO2G6]